MSSAHLVLSIVASKRGVHYAPLFRAACFHSAKEMPHITVADNIFTHTAIPHIFAHNMRYLRCVGNWRSQVEDALRTLLSGGRIVEPSKPAAQNVRKVQFSCTRQHHSFFALNIKYSSCVVHCGRQAGCTACLSSGRHATIVHRRCHSERLQTMFLCIRRHHKFLPRIWGICVVLEINAVKQGVYYTPCFQAEGLLAGLAF
jgi:hypothetical protein